MHNWGLVYLCVSQSVFQSVIDFLEVTVNQATLESSCLPPRVANENTN